MSIRLKIVLYQVLVAVMLLSTAAATYISIERIDYYFDRTRIARQQMDTVMRLSAHMNRYSENIAELLLLGRTELDDFYAARSSLEDGLALLTSLIEEEVAFIRSPEEREEEREELARVGRMQELFADIDLTAQRLLFMREQGRLEEATRLFREGIEESLDAELEDHVAAAIADEEAELREHRGSYQPARAPADAPGRRGLGCGAPGRGSRRGHAVARPDATDPRADRGHPGDRRGRPQLPHRLRPP